MMCVFSQQYYVCLTHYLVDEIGRFLSTKIPILYNKLSKTSTTYQHIILSTLKNVNRFFFRNFWCFINSMYVPVVTLSVTFFSHIQKHKNGGKVNIVASCSTFSKYLPLFFQRERGQSLFIINFLKLCYSHLTHCIKTLKNHSRVTFFSP